MRKSKRLALPDNRKLIRSDNQVTLKKQNNNKDELRSNIPSKPEFFLPALDQKTFEEMIRPKWAPKLQLPLEDVKRINNFQTRALNGAWNYYMTTSNALHSGRIILLEHLSSDWNLYNSLHWDGNVDKVLSFIKKYEMQFADAKIQFIVTVKNRVLKKIQPLQSFLRWLYYLLQSPYFQKSSDESRNWLKQFILADTAGINQPYWTDPVADCNSCLISQTLAKATSHPKLYMIPTNTLLMLYISNSEIVNALAEIVAGADVNQYCTEYGNNPLLLSIMKGWHHYDREHEDFDHEALHETNKQQAVIEKLLGHPDIDVNVINLFTGMTPLHLACLRADNPQLIKLLLAKGAKVQSLDYDGQTALDLINTKMSYSDIQRLVLEGTRDMNPPLYNTVVWEIMGKYNKSATATLPLESEQRINRKQIERILVESIQRI